MGCHLTQETRVQSALDDVEGNGPGGYCSPRHGVTFNSRDKGSEFSWMMWQALPARPYCAAFHAQDLNGDSFITADEFKTLLNRLGGLR